MVVLCLAKAEAVPDHCKRMAQQEYHRSYLSQNKLTHLSAYCGPLGHKLL